MKLRFMGTWDKITAALTILIGVVFLILGVLGLFAGCKAHFSLPPVLGGLPFLLGWAMCILLYRYWKISNAFKNNRIFVCPRCQKIATLHRSGKLACSDCGLRLEIYDPIQ